MRTDIHSPSNFDPAAYSYLGLVYLGWDEEFMNHVDDLNGEELQTYELMKLVDSSSYTGNYKRKHTCDHCGASFLYGAVYKHSNNDVIVVGHQCSYNAFGCNTRLEYEFKRLQSIIANKKLAEKMEIKVKEFLLTVPNLEVALKTKHYIIDSLNHNLFKYGNLSEKQVALAFKIESDEKSKIQNKLENDAKEAELPKTNVIEGKCIIIGTVLGFKTYQDQYGSHCKMIIRDDRGFKVYGSVPKDIDDDKLAKGKKVKFTANIQKSKDDQYFGFFKRPTKAEIIE